MKKIGIIGPSELEIMSFVEGLTQVKGSTFAMLPFYEGKCGQLDVAVTVCGICKVNAAIAAQTLISQYGAETLILCGVAGGIDPGLQIGDTVLSKQIAYHDVASDILTKGHPKMESVYFQADPHLLAVAMEAVRKHSFGHIVVAGKIVTGEAFIDQEGRARIIAEFDPLCVDMETGAAAHVCYANKIPFFAIRSITDTAQKSGLGTFAENVAESSKTAIAVLKAMLSELQSAEPC